MDGLLFYWIVWMMWIYVTFLMPKDRKRLYLAIWILLLLLLSTTEVLINGFRVNMTILVLYFGSIILLSQFKNWVINTFRSLSLVFGYVGILFWEQISPIWMIASRNVVIPILGLIILLFLSESYLERCVIWCLGLTTGEIIHGLLLYGYGFQEYIGDMAFMDTLVVEIALLSVFEVVKEIKWRIDSSVQAIEKQKKRWTS